MIQFSDMQQETAQACVVDLTPPVGGVIAALSNNPDGSVKASWGAATDLNAPILYEVYVQKATNAGLFATLPFLTRALSLDIYRDSLFQMLQAGETLFVGVRARDALGNLNANTQTQSIVAAGLGYANLIAQIPPAVWDRPLSAHVANGTFGKEVQDIEAKTSQITFTAGNVNSIAQVVADKTGYALTSAQVTAIAVAVEAALLNDGDGQALIDAIVASIGNQNIDQILLVAAIRADLERVGGAILSRASQTSVNALELETDALSRVNAVLAAINAIPTVTPPTPAQIADAVWDEATADHVGVGSFGLKVQTPSINAAQVADAVWDAPIADHNDPGTFGANAQSPAVNPAQIADAVWDAPLADHLDIGSTGKKLSDGLTAANFIPAGQQIEVEISQSPIEVEVNPSQEIKIEIGDC